MSNSRKALLSLNKETIDTLSRSRASHVNGGGFLDGALGSSIKCAKDAMKVVDAVKGALDGDWSGGALCDGATMQNCQSAACTAISDCCAGPTNDPACSWAC